MHRDSQFPVLSDSDHSHGHVTVSRSSPPEANLNLPVNGTHGRCHSSSLEPPGTIGSGPAPTTPALPGWHGDHDGSLRLGLAGLATRTRTSRPDGGKPPPGSAPNSNPRLDTSRGPGSAPRHRCGYPCPSGVAADRPLPTDSQIRLRNKGLGCAGTRFPTCAGTCQRPQGG